MLSINIYFIVFKIKIHIYREYLKDDKILSTILKEKYDGLSDLHEYMIQPKVSKRCKDIEEILKNHKHLWTLYTEQVKEELEKVIKTNN